MYYAPMCCLPTICYQMTVSDIVNDHSSIEIPTSSENGQHGDNLQLKSENEEIHSNESPPIGEEQQNSVREINIYDEINNIIQYCKEQDFNNPDEILKYLQENLVQVGLKKQLMLRNVQVEKQTS